MEKIAVICSLSIFSLFACGFKEPVGEVISGNVKFAQGNYEESTLDYFRALETGLSGEWIMYNLGNVYDRIGEREYAVKELRKALSGKDQELLFRARFNLGNIFFGAGEYRNAFEEYKAALRIRPASEDAKKNLEITAKKIENEDKRHVTSQSGETRMSSEVAETLKNAQDREVYVWKYAEPGGSATYKKDW